MDGIHSKVTKSNTEFENKNSFVFGIKLDSFADAVKRSFETIVLNGKIKTSNLGVARVAQTVDELKNRIKRDTQSISHSSVTISSINNIVWNDFVSSIYRIGSTRKINGLSHFEIDVF